MLGFFIVIQDNYCQCYETILLLQKKKFPPENININAATIIKFLIYAGQDLSQPCVTVLTLVETTGSSSVNFE